MKTLKIFLAAVFAAVCLSACVKDDNAPGTITVNGKTYTNVVAEYRLEARGLWVLLTFGDNNAINGSAQVDAERALGKDLKGTTLKIPDEGGYGDWLCCFFYGGGLEYDMTPAKGTQTIKKKDATHYSIVMDVTDENAKAFKLNVVASQQKD